MTRTKRLVARVSMVALVIAFLAIGGAIGAWLTDHILGISAISSRDVVASRRKQVPFLGIVVLAIAFGGAYLAFSIWPSLARVAGLSEEEILEVTKPAPPAPDA